MWAKTRQPGFTIVELLTVIVVIAILAAVTIVAFNGVQNRARLSAVAADFSNNKKALIITASATGNDIPSTVEMLQSNNKPSASGGGVYRLSSYCSSSQGYAFAVETVMGDKYYSLNGAPSVQNNSIDVSDACTGLGIANANRIFLGMSTTSCAGEEGTCTFSGKASIAFGSVAQGKFTAKSNLTSPASCSNTFFGDPVVGVVKACYILNY